MTNDTPTGPLGVHAQRGRGHLAVERERPIGAAEPRRRRFAPRRSGDAIREMDHDAGVRTATLNRRPAPPGSTDRPSPRRD